MMAVRIALALLVAAALLPELSRYGAERQLYEVSAVLQAVGSGARVVANPGGAVMWAVSRADDASSRLPGDWRPLLFAGSGLLLVRQVDQALDRYRRALELGERPEIDVNLGRAYARLGLDDRARAAFVRAAWISPALLDWLPLASRDALGAELSGLGRALVDGRLTAPPALPRGP
jgi:tetratricopeptide (TPR) repeat protein